MRSLLVLGLVAVLVGAPAGASAAPHDDGGWTTDVTASTARPRPGDVVTFTVDVESSTSRSALIDLEVYDSSWQRVFQEFRLAEAFSAGTSRTFRFVWEVPSDVRGELRVRLGVFSPRWGALFHWNDDPLRLEVTTGAPTTTTVPATTTTVPRPTTTTVPATTTTSPPPTTTTVPATTTAAPRPTTTVPATTTTSPRPTTTTTTQPPAATTTVAPTPTTAPQSGSQFAATFETASDFYDRFQLDVHFRDDDNVEWDRVFSGDHDMACAAPTSQRSVQLQPEIDGANRDLAKSQLFWWCAPGGEVAKGHVMTGMADVDGYTILSFAPNRSFRNISEVCWDVNLTDLGGRKWTQVLVVPEAAFQANGRRLDYISPITEAVDQTAVPLPEGSFMWQNWDHKARLFEGHRELHFDSSGFTTDDKAKRYQHCMRDNGDGTVTTTQERDAGSHSIRVPGSFPDEGRVIFQDDNYTPEKDGSLQGFTWHWDNIIVR